MAGLDDLLGSLTKQGAGGGGGLDDLLGGATDGSAQGGGLGGLEDVLGGLLGGGASGSPERRRRASSWRRSPQRSVRSSQSS